MEKSWGRVGEKSDTLKKQTPARLSHRQLREILTQTVDRSLGR